MALPWTCKKQDVPKKTKTQMFKCMPAEKTEELEHTKTKNTIKFYQVKRDKRHDSWWLNE